MKDIDKKIIELALDTVIDKFTNQDFITQDFANYSKILKNRYLQNQSLHIRKRKCSIIGCNEESIKKSHSIPKSSILKNIALNGHVFKPEFNTRNDFPKNEMVEIGINNASVFPGYCIKHENIFKSFEIDGKFDNAKKALLQTYRTICRERTYREIELEINDIIKNEYKQKINEDAHNYLKDILSKYPQFNDIEKVKIDGVDRVINSLKYMNDYLAQPIEQFKIFEKNILNWILKLPFKNNLIVRVVNIDFHLPISVCGFANQTYIEKNKTKNACILINVMPHQSTTDIICVGLEQDRTLIENYFDFSFSDPINILNMIESFIINGTDHWFINPGYWNNFTSLKQEKILYDILFTEDSFIDEYKFSIFDDVRIKIIKILTTNFNSRQDPITPFEKEKLNREIIKLKNTDYDMIKDIDVLIDKLNNMLYKKE
ncbi:hypothetical protein G7A72_07020 [Flavobacterium sp. Sr18]|uniref:hypothetical protein n=1 Tax=Flavobacterium sp. Sr18 TaxID=935222 RepID=UPI0013E5222B|nr:hypothetical protein [Flavobacterium sp. Sr18]QIH38561.1 hypothetical protein G7A72_07020 [Flavobacterium sp. Sr18]